MSCPTCPTLIAIQHRGWAAANPLKTRLLPNLPNLPNLFHISLSTDIPVTTLYKRGGAGWAGWAGAGIGRPAVWRTDLAQTQAPRGFQPKPVPSRLPPHAGSATQPTATGARSRVEKLRSVRHRNLGAMRVSKMLNQPSRGDLMPRRPMGGFHRVLPELRSLRVEEAQEPCR